MLKKKTYSDDEILIFDAVVVYLRNDIWQFRMRLADEKKYVRVSLNTSNRQIAVERAKQKFYEIMAAQGAGKKYFSITAKQGVEKYLEQRKLDVNAGLIVKGRLATITTHLKHWLDFIGRDTKLKDLRRADCENYFATRTKTKKTLSISAATVLNEQATINAMISWLHKRDETSIEAFDFKKLKRTDHAETVRARTVFDDNELFAINDVLLGYRKQSLAHIDSERELRKYLACTYQLIAMMTGMRRGEQLQLAWQDINLDYVNMLNGEKLKDTLIATVRVRAETSKVRNTRYYKVEDANKYFEELKAVQKFRWDEAQKQGKQVGKFEDALLFSVDFQTPLTVRNIDYWFYAAIDAAKIDKADEREIVPYCFRHTFITGLVNKGLNVATVAEMCGTSITQIERTYYHTTEQKMMVNAMPGYDYVDGVLVLR